MLRWLAALTSICLVSGTAHAADIRVTRPGPCAIALDGAITSGDLARLKSAVKDAGLETYDAMAVEGGQHSICLDSGGGSDVEALWIAGYVREHALGTRIVAGARCYAACSLVFMAGYISGAEVDGTYRFLSAGGKLGFRAPRIDVKPAASFSPADLETALRRTASLVAGLTRLANERGPLSARPMIELSLLAAMWATKGDDLVAVETIEDAARWNIDLFDLNDDARPKHLSHTRICANFMGWVAGDRNTGDEATDSPDDAKRQDGERVQLKSTVRPATSKAYFRVEMGGYASLDCLVGEDMTDNVIELCVVDEFTGVNHGSCPDAAIAVRPYYGLRAKTPISALLKKSS